jgi:hypothetical protein
MPRSPRRPAAHPVLLEPWFAELDRLARRRVDNRAAIAAHVDKFLDAARDWEAITGERATTYRCLLRERIDRALASPWPTSRRRTAKLTDARRRLDARDG